MAPQDTHWKRRARKTLYTSKFLELFSDTVELPNGTIIDDYSVVRLMNGVVIIATDEENRLITQYEYKYAVDKTILNLPSGGIEEGQSPLEAAAKELLEETGYESDELEIVQTVYEYPSKLEHVIHFVRAKNARPVKYVSHEETENISPVKLLSVDDEDYGGVFDATYTIAGLALTLPEFLVRQVRG